MRRNINLNNINLSDNFLTNDIVDDIFITLDTFFIYNGYINIDGPNNGIPSSYAETPIRDLKYKKNWTIIPTTN